MWLTELHLPQYATSFTLAGYHFLKDLRNLNEEKLLEMDNIPTGHRRRILSSLETLMMEDEGSSVKVPVKRKPIPRPRQVLSKDKQKEASTYQHAQAGNVQMTRQTLPARTTAYSGTMNVGSQTLPRIKCHAASSGSSSTSDNGSSESLENFTEDHVTNRSGGLPADGAALGFQGEMVENEIYEECLFATVPSEPRSTRSFKLRHRPVPEIPEHPFIPSYDRNVAGNNNTDHLTRSEGLILPPSHQKASLERTLSPISPYGELFLFNSAENVLDLSKDEMSNQVKETLEQQKLRHKQTQAKEKVHYNNKQDLSKQHIDDDKNVDEDDYDDYSTVQASSFCQQITNEHPTPPTLLSSTGPSAVSAQSQADVNVIYSLAHDDQPGLLKPSVPPRTDLSISPYACFYGICKTATKAGWLDKLSPQG